MENLMGVITWVTSNLGTIGTGLLAILGGFSILAKLTPTEADDKIVSKLIGIIQTLGLNKKK